MAESRIYEHYISVLKQPTSPQMTMFAELPHEVHLRDIGGVYTPQYIARFFARFLKENHLPRRFRALAVADPACGSGIFLRTLLEMQCDPMQQIDVTAVASDAFRNILGIDVEQNACKATRLSLTLLHLVLTGALPTSLRIENSEAVDYFLKNPALEGAFDAVLANPPFVKWDRIPEAWQPRVSQFLADYDAGKADLYLAFVKLGLDLLRPGGYMLYVLPHAFLLAQNAAKLRHHIAESCWIRFLADLSDADVFEDASSYPILLILQRKRVGAEVEPTATIVRCTSFAGHALQEALEGKQAETPFYSIYGAAQSAFRAPTWRVLAPAEARLRDQLSHFPKLASFLRVKEGLITGANNVFIRRWSDIPEGERSAYRPFLSDRGMERFRVPRETSHGVFYPFDGDTKLDEREVRIRFPRTWEYLERHERVLSSRRSVHNGTVPWWRPERPRSPKALFRPKIVSPHLILFPRFALDAAGKYAVSHSPILYPIDRIEEIRVLRYFLAVLNSRVGH